MTPQTIHTLSKLNQHFYEVSGSRWNPKPNYYWEGWIELLKHLEFLGPKACVKVLDIGCGNGRFSNFLMEYLPEGTPKVIEYMGIDFAVPMLEQITGNNRMFLDSPIHSITREFLQVDLINESIENLVDYESFDLVVAFGVLHHIPSSNLQLKLVQNWGKYLKPDGLLALTTWQYLDVPRLAKHCLDNNEFITMAIYQGLGIDITEMEKGDNLLKWVKYVPEGQYTLRYSHYFEDIEIEDILKKSQLNLITKYKMDGGKERRNQYWLTKKQVK